jgi:hypothetical protein
MIYYVYEATGISNINMLIYWHSITQLEKKRITIFLSYGMLCCLVWLKWNYVSEEPIQEISLNLRCTLTRLRGITTHYTEIFIIIFFPKHTYIMLLCFAIFFYLLTLTTRLIIYIIDMIPALSLRTPVKNDIIQLSDVSFGNIRVTSGHIGRGGWRCVC